MFDYSSRRLLDVLSKIQPAGGIPAGGTLQFQFCSINMGGSVVTSATCFESYGGSKPVIVKIASRSATDTLPPIGFNACYTDKSGSPNKCLVFTIAQSCANSVQPSYSNNVASTIGEPSVAGITHGDAWGQSWGPAPPQGWGGSGSAQSYAGSAGSGGAAGLPPPGHFAAAGAAVDGALAVGLNNVAQLVPGAGNGKQAQQATAEQARALAEPWWSCGLSERMVSWCMQSLRQGSATAISLLSVSSALAGPQGYALAGRALSGRAWPAPAGGDEKRAQAAKEQVRPHDKSSAVRELLIRLVRQQGSGRGELQLMTWRQRRQAGAGCRHGRGKAGKG